MKYQKRNSYFNILNKTYFIALFYSVFFSYIYFFLSDYSPLPFFETCLMILEVYYGASMPYFMLSFIGITTDLIIGDYYFLTTSFLMLTTLLVRRAHRRKICSSILIFLSMFLKIFLGLSFFGKEKGYCIKSGAITLIISFGLAIFCLIKSFIDQKINFISNNKSKFYKINLI